MQQPGATCWLTRWRHAGHAPQNYPAAKERTSSAWGLLGESSRRARPQNKVLVLPGAVVAKNRLWGMQFTLWFSLQCFLLAPRMENGNEPAGCFPKEVPPVPYSCPNTGKPRGTHDPLRRKPETFKMPALLLVLLHVQSVLKADLFFWHHFWIWDLPFSIPP